MGASISIYALKVELKYAPRYLSYAGGVFRTLEVCGNHTLHALHRALHAAFGHEGNRDYHFSRRVRGKWMACAEGTTVDSLGLKKGERFTYEYDVDFHNPESSDEWTHEIRVIAIRKGPPSDGDPKVVESVGFIVRPPSDYGGAEQEGEKA